MLQTEHLIARWLSKQCCLKANAIVCQRSLVSKRNQLQRLSPNPETPESSGWVQPWFLTTHRSWICCPQSACCCSEETVWSLAVGLQMLKGCLAPHLPAPNLTLQSDWRPALSFPWEGLRYRPAQSPFFSSFQIWRRFSCQYLTIWVAHTILHGAWL